MRADSPPEPDLRGLSRITSSVRTRIFAALLLASAPGIVFGLQLAEETFRALDFEVEVLRLVDEHTVKSLMMARSRRTAAVED